MKALKDKGREVEYMLLEDEGHGFSKKENEIAVYQKSFHSSANLLNLK